MAGTPQDRPAAKWPDGQREAPPPDLGFGCCCYGDQEGYWVGCPHLHGPPAGMNEGHCGRAIICWYMYNNDKRKLDGKCVCMQLTTHILLWKSKRGQGAWATGECVPAPTMLAEQPEVTAAPKTARWLGRHCRAEAGQTPKFIYIHFLTQITAERVFSVPVQHDVVGKKGWEKQFNDSDREPKH